MYNEERDRPMKEEFGGTYEEAIAQDPFLAAQQESWLRRQYEEFNELGVARAQSQLKSKSFAPGILYDKAIFDAYDREAQSNWISAENLVKEFPTNDQAGRAYRANKARNRVTRRTATEGARETFSKVVEERERFFDEQEDKTPISQATDEFIDAMDTPTSVMPNGQVLGVVDPDGSINNPMVKRLARQIDENWGEGMTCLLYTSPSPRDRTRSRMPSSA